MLILVATFLSIMEFIKFTENVHSWLIRVDTITEISCEHHDA